MDMQEMQNKIDKYLADVGCDQAVYTARMKRLRR